MDIEMKPNVSSITVVPTVKKTLYPINKMKASGKMKRRIGLKRAEGLTRRIQPEASGSNSNGREALNLSVRPFKGDCAPYNDHANWVHDPSNCKVYMIGGIRPSNDNWEPTSDFFCYDTRTFTWENLTDFLHYREMYDPYSKAEIHRSKKRLPARSQPGCTLFRHDDTSFIFMFGGFDPEATVPSSRVIIINLKERQWWYERFDQDPTPRIAPAIVAIQNKVYLFGGYRSYDEDPQACYSYSIVELKLTPQGHRWSWSHCDVPYPDPLSQATCIGQAISVYEGKMIFLAPGRTNDNDDRMLEFTDRNLFYFRLRDLTFSLVPIIGEPPRNIQWYSIFDLQSAFDHIRQAEAPAVASSSNKSISAQKKRGRPRKYSPLPAPPQDRISTPHHLNSIQRPPPSIVICAWLNQPSNEDDPAEDSSDDDEYMYPEIYRFDFHPEDICKSLNAKAKIATLHRDFQGCAYVKPGSLCLLGNHEAGDSDDDNDRMVTDSNGGNEKDKTWNIYLEVPIDV